MKYCNLMNASVEVLGLGISNRPLLSVLESLHCKITARDSKSESELGTLPSELKERGISLVCGEDYLKNLSGQYIFRSPGIRPDKPEILSAVEKGAVLTSEMELFLQNTPAKVFAITGSDGKTTTTTMTGLLLEEACKKRGYGKVWVGGNIGTPLLPHLSEMTKDDFVVVELSSFQLFTMDFSLENVALINLSENHLNWHPDMYDYANAKANAFRHKGCKRLILDGENQWTPYFQSMVTDQEVTLCYASRHAFSREVLPLDALEDRVLLGDHNYTDYMLAIALTAPYIDEECIRNVATTFRGVHYRMELIAEKNGVKYLDSSIDSTPARTMTTLHSLQSPVVVICGGRNKNLSYDELGRFLKEKTKAVVLFGESTPIIATALQKADAKIPVVTADSMKEAVEKANAFAVPGDIVILSPACTSFDHYHNYEERGEDFCLCVKELLK